MASVSQLKNRIRTEKGVTPFAQQQQMISELPSAMKVLQKQTNRTYQTVKDQLDFLRKIATESSVQIGILERIHDRLDAQIVETRVTNMLLSELIALHQSVITEETDAARDSIREDAYRRILSGE